MCAGYTSIVRKAAVCAGKKRHFGSETGERRKEMEAYVAQTKNLTKYYGSFCALDKVSISVKRGMIYGLIGDNGAGKSTLLKLLAGQIFASEGEISLFGETEAAGIRRARARIGVSIENAGFWQQLSVEKNLEYFRLQKGIPGKHAVEEALEMTGLKNAAKKKCRELSLGMRQRLGLAIALIGVPEFLILDEPINGLDPSGILEMRNILVRLNQEKRITILLSSHILSELEQMATEYGFLQDGVLLEQVSAKKLHEKCRDYIEIQVSDPERYTVLLEQKLHHTDYQILPGGRVHILNSDLPTELFGSTASENGLSVIGLRRCQRSLSEYYMELKRGGNRR